MTSPVVLVTGGAGFVGSHACKALARAGFLPVVYDNLSNGVAAAVRWGPLEVGALEDEGRLADVVARHSPAAVLHFAALIDVGASVDRPDAFRRTNVGGTHTLLGVMRAAGIGTMVFSSSAAVYGDAGPVPIPEGHRLEPCSPYGRSKLAAERILADAAAAHGLRYAALRYFNAAGADPEGELGENHRPETHLVPLAIEVAAGLRSRLSVFGSDYATPDGTCVRDYVHVGDLADGHVAALRRLLAGGGSLIANLGTGRGHSVREVIGTVATVTGRAVRVVEAGRRPGDPEVLVADPGLARRELSWAPRFPDLHEQVRHAAAWIVRSRRTPSP